MLPVDSYSWQHCKSYVILDFYFCTLCKHRIPSGWIKFYLIDNTFPYVLSCTSTPYMTAAFCLDRNLTYSSPCHKLFSLQVPALLVAFLFLLTRVVRWCEWVQFCHYMPHKVHRADEIQQRKCSKCLRTHVPWTGLLVYSHLREPMKS